MTPKEHAKELIAQYGIFKALKIAKRNANDALDNDSEDFYFDVVDEIMELCPDPTHGSVMGCDGCGDQTW